MNERVVSRIRGALGALSLATIVVSVPLALLAWTGDPRPNGLPTREQFDAWLHGADIDVTTKWKVVGWVGWALWLVLVVCVVYEVAQRVIEYRERRRTGTPAPDEARERAGFGKLACTVVGVAGLGLLGAPRGHAAVGLPAPDRIVQVDPIPAAALTPLLTEEPSAPTAADETVAGIEPIDEAPGAALPRHVVAPRESLWGIARNRLGDGSRWREVFELNRGRLEDPDRPLAVGQELVLPPDAVELDHAVDEGLTATSPSREDGTGAGPEEDAAAYEAATVALSRLRGELEATEAALGEIAVVEPGGHLWALAEETLTEARGVAPTDAEVGPYWRELVEANRDRLVDPADPDLVYPGQEFVLPAVAVDHDPVPTGPDVDAATVGHDVAETVSPERGAEETGPGANIPFAALAAGGLTLAGVVGTLNRLRRHQERRRPHGRRPRWPRGASRVEMSLRAHADPDAESMLSEGLRLLSACAGDLPEPLPPVEAVEVDRDRIAVHFATEPEAPPTGWEQGDEGRTWVRRPTEADAAGPGEAAATPLLPALVSVGQTAVSPPRTYLSNLEHHGSVGLRGGGPWVADTLRAMALELATTDRAEYLFVVLVGFGRELADLDRVRVVPDLSVVLDEMERRAESFREALDAVGADTPQEARAKGSSELWEPTVVLAAGELDPGEVERLTALANDPPSGVVAVVPTGPWTVGAVFEVYEDRIEVSDGGPVLLRPVVPEEVFEPVGLLFEAAVDLDEFEEAPPLPEAGDPMESESRDRPGVEVSQPDNSPTSSATSPPSSSTPGEADWDVRILGPPGVWRPGTDEGAVFKRAKALELVVYLASHGGSARTSIVRTDLWPDTIPHDNTLATTAWHARQALGSAPDGTSYVSLARHPEHSYRLSERVACDFDRFRRLVAAGRDAPPEVEREGLRAALELVRGEPFSGTPTEYHWAYVNAFVSEVVASVADAAHRLAELCLDAGDPEGAFWATARGLTASPGHEGLYRDRMRAADAAGNLTLLDDTWEELLRILAEPGAEVDDMPHEETCALYRRLRNRPRLATSPSA